MGTVVLALALVMDRPALMATLMLMMTTLAIILVLVTSRTLSHVILSCQPEAILEMNIHKQGINLCLLVLLLVMAVKHRPTVLGQFLCQSTERPIPRVLILRHSKAHQCPWLYLPIPKGAIAHQFHMGRILMGTHL